MMSGASAFEQLPNELLLRILVILGSEDVVDLAHVGAASRRLREFVYGPDQVLWRTLHRQRYSDPSKAGAYLRPRDKYDWRSSVIERQWFITITNSVAERRLTGKPALVPPTKRYCDVLTGLWSDLAPGTRPCLNSMLLLQLRSPEFAHLSEHRLYEGGDTLSLLHLLRLAVAEDPEKRKARLAARVPRAWEVAKEKATKTQGAVKGITCVKGSAAKGGCAGEHGPLAPNGTVAWTFIDAVASELLLCMHNKPDAYSTRWLEYSFGQMLEDVRGPGLLGIDPKDVGTDWAGVGGRWTCEAFRFAAPDAGPWTVGDYDIVPVADLPAVKAAYSRHSDAESAETRLKDLAPAHPWNDALPPVYFVGEGRGPRESHGDTSGQQHFVCGVVRLTTDNPPQLHWTWVIEHVVDGYDDLVLAISSVQLGGRGTRAGLFGHYRDLYLYDGHAEGGVWLWKEE